MDAKELLGAIDRAEGLEFDVLQGELRGVIDRRKRTLAARIVAAEQGALDWSGDAVELSELLRLEQGLSLETLLPELLQRFGLDAR